MKKRIAMISVAAMLFAAMPQAVWSGETSETEQAEETVSGAAPEEEADGDAVSSAAPEEEAIEAKEGDSAEDNIVTTKHTAVIAGKELPYTAEAGTMILETGGYRCEIFYTAYTLDGVEDVSERPVTFAFNGGPGSCSMPLHIGCLGPRRIDVDENGYAKTMPAKVVDNENSLLDLTDLVIIDAVGT